jgi:hypothetical protein
VTFTIGEMNGELTTPPLMWLDKARVDRRRMILSNLEVFNALAVVTRPIRVVENLARFELAT